MSPASKIAGWTATLLFALPAARAQQAVVDLSLNENPYGPSPLVVPAVREEMSGLYRYVTNAEVAELTALLAAKEGVAPEQIVLGDLLEPLGLYLSLKEGPGGEFIYSVPGYPALTDAAARVGGVVIGVPLDRRMENDLPAIAARVGDRTRAVFLVNPHNPSGTVNDAAKLHEFLRTVSKKALVVVDEAYLEYSDDFAGRTAAAHTRAGENVLVYRTLAKVWGLAGMPLGYAVAPRPVADFLRQQGLGGAHDQNRLTLVAAAAGLHDPGYIEGVRTAVAAERVRWHAALDALGLRHTDSQANFVYFDAGRPQTQVAAALQAEGVIVARAFPPYDNWVRITIGLPEENVRAQQALRKVLAK
ncbi:MAG: histidinol-phosphate transaminase [Steroidobacteraceae bacterium]